MVDDTGAVARAEVLENASGEPAFADAVLSAVRGWTFVPLLRVSGEQVEPLPFSQDYRFTFRQLGGRPVVEGGRAP